MLIRAQLAHFEDLVGRRIIIDGTALLVAAPAAQSIAMAVHELATNAVKHGALSGERGQVDIAWQVQDGEAGELRFLMSWRESGGPPARLPTHRGFGSKVIKDMIELGLEGEVQLQFAASGLVWQLDCPAAKVSEDRP
jgi:two-component sensor histidine kinase